MMYNSMGGYPFLYSFFARSGLGLGTVRLPNDRFALTSYTVGSDNGDNIVGSCSGR